MEFTVSTLDEADEAIEYFNSFHDGFIRRFSVVSLDRIEPDKSLLLTGEFLVELELCHYNYRKGEPAYDQTILARFHGVKGLELDLREVGRHWAINSLTVVECDGVLTLRLARNHLEDDRRWAIQQADLFGFETASFREC